ncbi:hypothetical protein [Corynebacterium neomassiliense]|nr:hypothetical protein [Corynebacterium neomassiliense]
MAPEEEPDPETSPYPQETRRTVDNKVESSTGKHVEQRAMG